MTGRPRTQFLKRFVLDETGAVTVDFVVLAATVVSLAISATVGMQNATTALAEDAAAQIAAQESADDQDAGTGGGDEQEDAGDEDVPSNAEAFPETTNPSDKGNNGKKKGFDKGKKKGFGNGKKTGHGS